MADLVSLTREYVITVTRTCRRIPKFSTTSSVYGSDGSVIIVNIINIVNLTLGIKPVEVS